MRTYRVGATLRPFLGWNGFLALPIVALLVSAPEHHSTELLVSFAVAALLILAGPVALLAYLARFIRVRVAVEPAGLRLSDRSFVR